MWEAQRESQLRDLTQSVSCYREGARIKSEAFSTVVQTTVRATVGLDGFYRVVVYSFGLSGPRQIDKTNLETTCLTLSKSCLFLCAPLFF